MSSTPQTEFKTYPLADELEHIGARLISSCPRASDGDLVVLAVWKQHENGGCEYATWRWFPATGLNWGDYYLGKDAAYANYGRRIRE